MITRTALNAVLAAGAALVLSLSACGPAKQSGVSSPGERPAAAETTTEAAANFAKVDSSLVTGLVPVTYVDSTKGVEARVPVIASARQMTSAMEVLRERGLREASWDKAEKVAIDYQVVAAGPGTLGIIVTPTWGVGGAEKTKPALVWYDADSKRVFSSPILVQEAQWGAFKAEVTKVAGKNKKIDKAKLAAALDADAAPQGQGPMLGFDAKGAMVVQFAPGVVAESAQSVSIPAAAAEPLLSDFGRRASKASSAPAAFDGTASGAGPAVSTTPAAPTAAGSTPGGGRGTATPSGSRGSATPRAGSVVSATPGAAASAEAAAPGGRPSTAVGPDCRKVTCAAVTYDDGPVEGSRTLVRMLTEAKAPATFFQKGESIKADPDSAKAVASAGNEVASHSYSHPNFVAIGPEKTKREMMQTADLMEKTYGRRPMLMRPPYGSHNAAVDAVIKETGAAIIQWEDDTNDWKVRNSATVRDYVLTAGTNSNSIILMHDIHPTTVAAAPEILKGLQDKGVTLVTTSELSLNSGGYEAGRSYCSGVAAARQSGFLCSG